NCTMHIELHARATQGTIGSTARRDAVEFSSDFQQGGGGGRPSRSHDSVRHLIALGTPRPGDARALIISGKRKVPRETGTQPASPYMGRTSGRTPRCVSAARPVAKTAHTSHNSGRAAFFQNGSVSCSGAL